MTDTVASASGQPTSLPATAVPAAAVAPAIPAASIAATSIPAVPVADGASLAALVDPTASGLARVARSRFVRRLRSQWLIVPTDICALLAPAVWVPQHWEMILGITAATVVLIHAGGLYRSRLSLSLLDEAPALLGRLLVASALAETALVISVRNMQWRPLIIAMCCSAGLLLLGRFFAYSAIQHARRTGLFGRRTVIVGSGPIARELTTTLLDYPAHGLRPIGYVGAETNAPNSVLPHLGDLSDLRAVVDIHHVGTVLVADGLPNERGLVSVFRQPLRSGTTVLVVPRLHEVFTVPGQDDHIGAVSVSRVRFPSLTGPARAVKRSFDILVSGIGLVLLAPLLAAVALAVRLESGPGVLFRQTRLGQDGKAFELLKFRSMRPASETESETNWSIAHDDRVGRVGRVLRRTSLDELPQLFNILRGDMTLVGPRPERPHFVELFSGTYVDYGLRHRVPVGLTGLAQVSGLRGDCEIDDRARYDNYYIDHWSLWLDVKVLLRTVREVLVGSGR